MASSEPEPVATEFDLYVDEFGTTNRDDGTPFGYGFFLVGATPLASDVEEKIKAAFPNGFHGRKIRTPRRLKATQKLLDLVPDGHFYGGGCFVEDPAYARLQAAEVLSEIEPRLHPATFAALAKYVRDNARLFTIYGHVARASVAAMLAIPSCPPRPLVRLRIGVVGDREEHARTLATAIRPLMAQPDAGFGKFVEAGVIPPKPCRVEVSTIARHPFHGAADMVANVVKHAARGDELGRQLLAAATPLLSRIKWLLGDEIGPTITVLRAVHPTVGRNNRGP